MDSIARIVTCLDMTISELKLPVREKPRLRNVIGLGLREAVLQLYPDADESSIERFTDVYRSHFLSDRHVKAVLFEGAKSVLTNLRDQGYFLAVATGKARKGLDRSMDESGCRDLFDITRCADEVFSKPHPQMLVEIMDHLGTMPSETLMIGDSEYDILMARNAGTDALAVDYGVHSKERLMALEPLHCLTDINEILNWLNQTAMGSDPGKVI